MADTWGYSAGVWTLTLDGTGSGQESRSLAVTGLTPDTLYTFYSTVDADTVDVGPFIEVDGGDRTTITSTGSALQYVRGTSDGSGNITLRRGVAEAGGAELGGGGSDSFEDANIAAMEGRGWAKTQVSGSNTWSLASSPVTDGTKALVVTGSGTSYYQFTLSGFASGQPVTVTCDVYQSSKHWYENSTLIELNGYHDSVGTSGLNTTYFSPAGSYKTLGKTRNADGSGNMVVRLKVGTETTGATRAFDNLRWVVAGGGTAEISFPAPARCVGIGHTLRPAA